MRVIIDMQGAQSSGSRHRGIGRYVSALAKAMAEQRDTHEVILAANGAFADALDAIRAEFDGLLPADAIRVWMPPQPCRALESSNDGRRLAAELTYEAFLASLQPDIVLIGSLFEGLVDDVATSVRRLGSGVPVAVVLYDLIPLIHKSIYLTNPDVSRWYQQKLDHLRRSELLLSISASSGAEAVEHLAFFPDQVVNIGTACDARFRPVELSAEQRDELARRYGLVRPYVMYTGGIDHRKNIEGLIRAYSLLPQALRKKHQLAVVCSVGAADKDRLADLARRHGLAPDELVMTGFVPDDDLLTLYNACALFVFPSWHEGFGLPALEAMACGRPTIGANTSSLPEVIGLEDALFDPHDDADIARVMARGLQDTKFREGLELHALRQAACFSWENTAQRVWAALEQLAEQRVAVPQSRAAKPRPRLAYVSPIPVAKSGIADYSAELLPELSRHYEIDVIVQQEEPVEDGWILANARLRSASWFRANHRQYDRVLYHFGNSHFHSHMFGLLEDVPGVVVLHDFFLSSIVAHRDITREAVGGWANALVHGHGWGAALERFKARDAADVVWEYPCNLHVLQCALGMIVHSSHARELAESWYGAGAGDEWSVLPLLRSPAPLGDVAGRHRLRADARRALGISDHDFVVCSFGHLGRTKLNHQLLAAWQVSTLCRDQACQLVFVGQNEGGEYGKQLAQDIEKGSAGRVRITGFVDQTTYRQWLLAADVAVQLRTHSRGETSAAVLDCWNHGLATVVNAHGALAELPGDTVIRLDDAFADADLAQVLDKLHREPALRSALGQRGRDRILAEHHPRLCADRYADAIEQAYARTTCGESGVLGGLQKAEAAFSEEDRIAIARTMAACFPPSPRRIQWLVDCSVLVQCDAKSGIQRVVRSLLRQLLLNPPVGVQLEPVYATPGQPGYRYARQFTCRLFDMPADWCRDEPVEAWAGDVFVALDLQPSILPEQVPWLQQLRARGVKVFTVVYDLLPLLSPSSFVEGTATSHHRWLQALAGFDGALTISRAVADELLAWMDAYGDKTRRRPFEVHHFHLGADIEQSLPSLGIPSDGSELLARLKAHPVFLMVGTLEPRKGHALVVDAFEQMWQAGSKAQLVIVGKQGWMVDALVNRLRQHPEAGRRLHWLEGISDEYLTELYKLGTALIAASEGEGFGLPLIEAARHGIPILARDIPVFREVAGQHAAYFEAKSDATALATSIKRWLADHGKGVHPKSTAMPWLTWAQSADAVKSILAGHAAPYRRWLPSPMFRYWGNDQRLFTQVGRRHGFAMETTGQDGFLFYGPYMALEAGRYQVTVCGVAQHWTGSEVFDVAYDGGKQMLVKEIVSAEAGPWSAAYKFRLAEDVKNLELRLWVSESSDLSVSAISIERLSI